MSRPLLSPSGGNRRSAESGDLRAADLRELAVAAANFAQNWRDTSQVARANLVHRLVDVLAPKIDDLAVLMAQELGKPIRFGRTEGRQSLEMLQAILRRTEGHHGLAEEYETHVVMRRPHGVVAAITPWNNPIYIALGKIVPAILYGNAVVWKPAPEARSVSRHLLRCFVTASWPGELVNLLEGGSHEAEALMNERSIDAVTITGSAAAGDSAQEICARRHVPLQAELGGNNASIVWSDADLPEAARKVAAGAFEMAGQRCTANRRVIVHAACLNRFVELLVKAAAAMQWGDPLDGGTEIGPLVSASHRDRVAGAVALAVAQRGSELLPLGERPPTVGEHEGKFYPPTIINCNDPAHDIVQEETFGPVLVVQPAQDWDEAIRLCNGVRQGLAAAVFATSPDKVRNFIERARAGILKVNEATAGAVVDAPFGGWKASGVGLPEHGSFDVEFFTRPQTVYRDRRVRGSSS
ncbi:MAG: aldehyde dehydrogenase family protein [Methyloceanibacter sp.]